MGSPTQKSATSARRRAFYPEPSGPSLVVRLMFRGLLITTVVAALTFGVTGHHAAVGGRTQLVEVVVRLAPVPLSHHGNPAAIHRVQQAFERAVRREVPSARVRWRYRIVLDGVALVLPARDEPRLARLPGVREVFQSRTYPEAAGPAVDQIGAPQLWGPDLASAGDGVKIGIIDVGVDQKHPFLDPTGFVMPPGYPKGQLAYTTAKVIVARTFPAPGQTAPVDLAPVDPDDDHGTHVAGIAAGDAGTRALGAVLSGVAPHAYIGNYRALTVPTDSGVGKDGNAPEIVAAIEAAVADGMNVINLSIGEPEIEPTRDVVALALDGAAAAGVVPVVSAGNDFREFGYGSVSSPGNAAAAITVGAVSTMRSRTVPNVVADFSSAGPTTISLRLKPDVVAPGVDVLSSVPGGWGTLSGTSMAAPHVSGGVALLRERHPTWSVAEIKAALIETADDTWLDKKHRKRAGPARTGGGVIDLPRADNPLVFTLPSSVSLGLVRAGENASASVTLADAGGGSGIWNVSLRESTPAGTTVSVPPTVDVPGTVVLTATTSPSGDEGDASGYVILEGAGDIRRIPFWFRVTRPKLPRDGATPLVARGLHQGDTRGRPAAVNTYRYPELPGDGIADVLAGPEQVFRVVLRQPVQNFGVVIVSRAPGVRVEPRVVGRDDENRLTGYASLPIVLNPYLAGLMDPVLASGAVRPSAGTYDVVFDSHTSRGAGKFTFRFWVNDTTPPTARLRSPTVHRGHTLVVRVADRGSGVDPYTAVALIDGKSRKVTFRAQDMFVDTEGISPGRHRLRFQISDYQETRNMENVGAVLPNTRRITPTFRIVSP